MVGRICEKGGFIYISVNYYRTYTCSYTQTTDSISMAETKFMVASKWQSKSLLLESCALQDKTIMNIVIPRFPLERVIMK